MTLTTFRTALAGLIFALLAPIAHAATIAEATASSMLSVVGSVPAGVDITASGLIFSQSSSSTGSGVPVADALVNPGATSIELAADAEGLVPGVGSAEGLVFLDGEFLIRNTSSASAQLTLEFDWLASASASTTNPIADLAFAMVSINLDSESGLIFERSLTADTTLGQSPGTSFGTVPVQISLAPGGSERFFLTTDVEAKAVSNVPVIPLPASLPLLGGSVLLLGALRRKET